MAVGAGAGNPLISSWVVEAPVIPATSVYSAALRRVGEDGNPTRLLPLRSLSAATPMDQQENARKDIDRGPDFPRQMHGHKGVEQ